MEGDKLMENNKKQPAILYIDFDKFFYFSSTTPVTQLPFGPEVIADQNVVSREKMISVIEYFVQTYRIEPSSLAILFSPNMTFERDFPEIPTQKDRDEIQKFIELVPYEEVITKTFRFNKKTRVLAINADLLDSVKQGFEKLQFEVIAASSWAILQEINADLAGNVDLSAALGKTESIKQYSVLEGEKVMENKPIEEKKTKNNTRMFILIGIFAALLVVLLITILVTSQPSSSKKVTLPIPTAVSAPTTTTRPPTTTETPQIKSLNGTVSTQSAQ